jgi:hypothetical protein
MHNRKSIILAQTIDLQSHESRLHQPTTTSTLRHHSHATDSVSPFHNKIYKNSPFHQCIDPGKASPTRHNKQEQESWGFEHQIDNRSSTTPPRKIESRSREDTVWISTPDHWQPQELPYSREGKEKRAKLTKEKPGETVDEGREVLAGGDARRHAVTSRRQAATSRRRLLASRAASRASRPVASSRRVVAAVGFELEGPRRGSELYCWYGLRNTDDVVSFLSWAEMNAIFLVQLDWK